MPDPWFLALPDTDSASAVAELFLADSVRRLSHPSGRVWLLGAWDPNAVCFASTRRASVLLVGIYSLNQDELEEQAERIGSVHDLTRVLAGVTGSFAVFATVDGDGYARGTLSGSHRLYTATRGNDTLLSDRPGTLAHLVGGEIDQARLAARLTAPGMPPPLDIDSPWTGVRVVRPAEAVTVRDGVARTAAWWHRPDPVPDVPTGATALRSALADAVALRVRGQDVVGADLSGGLDSTSLCFLAAAAGTRLVTATIHWSSSLRGTGYPPASGAQSRHLSGGGPAGTVQSAGRTAGTGR